MKEEVVRGGRREITGFFRFPGQKLSRVLVLPYKGISVIDEWFLKPSPAKAFCSNLLRRYLLAANNSHNLDCLPAPSHKECK